MPVDMPRGRTIRGDGPYSVMNRLADPRSDRAAQYVRMSTDHQRYSIANQIDQLRAYAEAKGLKVVKTYADEGRSGLTVRRRTAIQQLIADVEDGTAEFATLLIYDVSRWGRFQDADEAAFYEYRCRRAGVDVVYVAEPFENDGSALATVVKGLKRLMAGEYSRELSRKVFLGQCRLAQLGFHQGGQAPYAMQRWVVSETGKFGRRLKAGERKGLLSDRVTLRPGPPKQVAVVRWIFERFVEDEFATADIADALNKFGVPGLRGGTWWPMSIATVLSNRTYVGDYLFNRASEKLDALKQTKNAPEDWICARDAFEPIIDRETFEKAQALRRRRGRRHQSSAALLDGLRNLLAREGRITAELILADPALPDPGVLIHRFGSLLLAYDKIGYEPGGSHEARARGTWRVRAMRERIRIDLVEALRDSGHQVEDLGPAVIGVGGQRIAVGVLTPVASSTRPRWRCRQRFEAADWTVLVRVESSEGAVLDYLMLPPGEMTSLESFELGLRRRQRLDPWSAVSLQEIAQSIIGSPAIDRALDVDQ